MKPSYVRVAMALLVLAGVPSVGDASEHFHPKIKSGEVKIRSVMMLPVKAEVIKTTVTGLTSQPEQVPALREDAANAVTKALLARGIRLDDCPYSDAAVRDDQQLRAKLIEFERRYAELSVNVGRKPKDIEEGRYSFGGEIVEFVARADTDAVVVTRASASEKSGGLKFLTSSLAQGRHTDLTITLLDARSGDVLAHFSVGAGRKLDDPVAKALQKLPR